MITQFEELHAWQMARELVKQVYSVTSKGSFSKDYKFAGQIQSAALSVSSNIAEGFERGSKQEFIRFLMIAKASCAEVRSQLYSAMDVCHIDQDSFTSLINYAEQVGRIIGALRNSVEQKKNPPRTHN